jgi:hypothetical protein
VGDIGEEEGPDVVGDRPKAFKVQLAAVGASTGECKERSGGLEEQPGAFH